MYKAFALTGRLTDCRNYPGRCPGLGASALSGRVELSAPARRPGGFEILSPARRPGGFEILPPLGVPADLKSAVKKVRPIKTGGFEIPQHR